MTFFIETTFGAILLGGYCSAILSGVVIVQTFIYVKLFPEDPKRIKAIVGAVWTLDTVHTILVCVTAWNYLIMNYGNEKSIETLSIPLAMSGLITGVLTFIVHCFFSHRIYKLSRNQWQFTVLIVLLAFFRLCCASVTGAAMIHLKTLAALIQSGYRASITTGLAMSCAVDVLITGCLTYTLKALQKEKMGSSLDSVIGTVLMYTFETNMLTSAATVLAMVFWLTMSDTLIFMGIHFSISKLYANSLLATLNARKQLQYQRQRDVSGDRSSGFPRLPRRSTRKFTSRAEDPPAPTQLKITVEKMVEFGIDEGSPSQSFKGLSMSESQTK